MKLIIKSIICFSLFLSFSFSSNAQCVPTTPLQGNTTVCEGAYAGYYITYATMNSGTVNLSVTNGTILRTIHRTLNPKEALVAIVVKWNNTSSTSNATGTVQINKSATGCSATDTVNISILDSTTGGCN